MADDDDEKTPLVSRPQNTSDLEGKSTGSAPPDTGLRQRTVASEGKKARTEEILLAAADRAPPRVANIIRQAAPLLAILAKIINVVGPLYVKLFKVLLWLYKILPVDLMYALTGLGLCFTGGMYITAIAAVEAFLMCGWESTKENLTQLYNDFERLKASSEQDDKKDDDGDGIPDVEQISAQDLVTRKIGLALVAVEDPEKVSRAVAGLYTSWIGVQATLRLQFAKTIALGVSIGNQLRPIAQRVMRPILASLMEEKYYHWIDTIIDFIVKSIAVYIAWWIQQVISAVSSGIRGGFMFARGIMNELNKRGWLKIDHENTYADEVCGALLAAVGIWFQLSNNFSLPFPFNIVMFPLTCVEWYIRWTITE